MPGSKANITIDATEVKTAIADGIAALTGVATVDHAIEVLNRALKSDPKWMNSIFGQRFYCNEAIADDPTIQVGPNADGDMVGGVLGLLNGIFGKAEDGWGHIAAVVERDGTISRFEILDHGRSPKPTH